MDNWGWVIHAIKKNLRLVRETSDEKKKAFMASRVLDPFMQHVPVLSQSHRFSFSSFRSFFLFALSS
jgi:hypothetical protein